MKTMPLRSLLLALVSLVPCMGQAGFLRQQEVEDNNTAVTATVLSGTEGVVQGNIFPNADTDFYAFTAQAGDRVYAATQTSFSASQSTDSVLELLAGDGTTVIEMDDEDGTLGASSSSIAGTVLTVAGTYYLKVRHFSATAQLRPYDLHYVIRSGSPDAEVEPNDSALTAQPLPASGWVAGATSSTTDNDFYSLNLNAGDSVYLSLDLDPERDTVTWNGQLAFGLFGGVQLVANDNGAFDVIDSEAFFMTVKEAGTYQVMVGVPAGGVTFGSYHLSVRVIPKAVETLTKHISTAVPLAIPTGPAKVESTLTVPGNPVIGRLRVSVQLTHNRMADLDAHLVSPSGNMVALFSDVGSSAVGAGTSMNLILDDEAALPLGVYSIVDGMEHQPELATRLAWFRGQKAGGTWTLVLNDDTAAEGGTLLGWSLEIVPPEPEPVVTGGLAKRVVYETDFETTDGGFTHSGTADEWELGTPVFAPLTSANSGVRCWKTDLDNTYNVSSSQDLVSPPINLAGVSGPILLHWAQMFQMETATFDRAFVEVREVGGANPRKVWEFLDATMTATVGSPTVTLQEAAGWGAMRADISDYAGKQIEVRFHFDSDITVQFAGWAVDDVKVTGAVANAPEMAVFDGTSVFAPELVDGVGSINLGNIGIGAKTVKRTFTLQNKGTKTLSGLFLSKVPGPHAGDLLLGPLGVTSLAPNATRAFTVTYSPQAGGLRTATLRIGSNDADESPFEITLEATGMAAVVPLVETMDATLAPFSIQLNGTVNAGGATQNVVFDYGTTKNYGTTTSAVPPTLSTMTPDPASLVLALGVELAPHTLYHYRIRAFSALGEAVGEDKTFLTPNMPVMAAPDSADLAPESTALLDVLANDIDGNGDPISLVKLGALTPPTAGIAKIVSGRVQFTSSASFTGATISYQADDGFGGTGTGNITFNLGAVILPAFSFYPSAAVTDNLPVTSAGFWNATEKVSWISLGVVSGFGPGNVAFSLQPNKSLLPRSGIIRVGGQNHTVTQGGVLPPNLTMPGVIPPAIVSGPYSLFIPTINAPVTYQVRNLPPGMKINQATGEISGTPLVAGTYNVIVNASNAAGKSPTTLLIPMIVQALQPGTVGSFHGLADVHPQINARRGDRVELKVSLTGNLSGKVITGTKTRSFTGKLIGVATDPDHPQVNITLPRPGGGSHFLQLVLDHATNTMTGNLNDGVVNTTPVQGWRRVWTASSPATAFAIQHSFRGTAPLASVIPQGFSFGSFKVNASDGAYTLTGRLADKSSFSTISFVGPAGQVLVYHALYGGNGSVAGRLNIAAGMIPELNAISGNLSWFKPPAAANSKDNVYRLGFTANPVVVQGGAYVPPAAGEVFMGLLNVDDNAKLDFTGGGLLVAQEPDITFSIRNPSATGFQQVVTIPSTVNNVTLPGLTPSTGSFNGGYVIPGTPPVAPRSAEFWGQLVKIGGVTQGYGFSILPQVPEPGETAATAPRQSGRVELKTP